MCNLYRMTKGTAEVAKLFGVLPDEGANLGEEVYPGYPGFVIAGGQLRTMTWGFPLVLKGRQGQPLKPKPVTNARDDKLHTAFWRDSFVHRRCLIPASAWAEPEGAARHMTRTWYAPKGQGDPFVIAGLWRQSAEWGAVYTMVMVNSCAQMADVHDRMPVLLCAEDRDKWLHGSADEAMALCRTSSVPLDVERSDVPWTGMRREARRLL